MQEDRWLGWAGLVILFLIIQAVRAVFRGMRAKPADGMARLDAAAKKILKERGAGAANPIPRAAASGAGAGRPRNRPQSQSKPKPQAKPRTKPLAALPRVAREPAVIRRGALFSAGEEPVIQRRR